MTRPVDTVLRKWIEIEKLRAKLAKLDRRRLDAEQKSAHWLMTANDLIEGPIAAVRARLRALGIEGGK